MTTIKIPSGQKPMSALDGYSLEALEHDPQETLAAALCNPLPGGPEIVTVIPVTFHGTTSGFLVLRYDKAKDPRAVRSPNDPTTGEPNDEEPRR